MSFWHQRQDTAVKEVAVAQKEEEKGENEEKGEEEKGEKEEKVS